jgi:hypothetical protein
MPAAPVSRWLAAVRRPAWPGLAERLARPWSWTEFFFSAPSPEALLAWAAECGSQPPFAAEMPPAGSACRRPDVETAARAFAAMLLADAESQGLDPADAERPKLFGMFAFADEEAGIRSENPLGAATGSAADELRLPAGFWSGAAAALRETALARGWLGEPSSLRWALAEAAARAQSLREWRLFAAAGSPREPLAGPGTPSLWSLSLERAFAGGACALLSGAAGSAPSPDPGDLLLFLSREAERQASVAQTFALARPVSTEGGLLAGRLVKLRPDVLARTPCGAGLLDWATRSVAGAAEGEALLRAGCRPELAKEPGLLVERALAQGAIRFATALLDEGAPPRGEREIELALLFGHVQLALRLAREGARFDWLAYRAGASSELGARLGARFWEARLTTGALFAGLKADFEAFDRFARGLAAQAERVELALCARGAASPETAPEPLRRLLGRFSTLDADEAAAFLAARSDEGKGAKRL